MTMPSDLARKPDATFSREIRRRGPRPFPTLANKGISFWNRPPSPKTHQDLNGNSQCGAASPPPPAASPSSARKGLPLPEKKNKTQGDERSHKPALSSSEGDATETSAPRAPTHTRARPLRSEGPPFSKRRAPRTTGRREGRKTPRSLSSSPVLPVRTSGLLPGSAT